jgi:hypothetical protein
MITTTNLTDALPIIVKDEAVSERLKADFSSILADLVTFRTNPNCTCRGRVFKFFTEQLEATPGILDKYVPDPAALQRELDVLASQRVANNFSGKVFEIQKGEQAWLQFSQTIAGKAFRGFSVVERSETVAVYLL